jgi:murein DD-endopeptidase MepM/ murein hydrolase activator NlpD
MICRTKKILSVFLLVSLTSACAVHYSQTEWAKILRGNEYGHVFYHQIDDKPGMFPKVYLPNTSPSVLSDYLAESGVRGGSRIAWGSGIHKGIDFYGEIGDPIISAADGVVIDSGTRRGMGTMIHVDHGTGSDGNRLLSFYLHASGVLVKKDDVIKRGQLIGKVGKTGRSDGGPHLHFSSYSKKRSPNSGDWGYIRWVERKSLLNPHKYWSGGAFRPECFEPSKTYPTDHTVFTIPLQCRG